MYITRLDLETLVFRPIMAQNPPGHWIKEGIWKDMGGRVCLTRGLMLCKWVKSDSCTHYSSMSEWEGKGGQRVHNKLQIRMNDNDDVDGWMGGWVDDVWGVAPCKKLILHQLWYSMSPTLIVLPNTKGRFKLWPSWEEKHHFSGPNYVERRSLWAEQIYQNNPLSYFEYFNEKKVWSLDESLSRAFCLTQTLLERPTLGAITS